MGTHKHLQGRLLQYIVIIPLFCLMYAEMLQSLCKETFGISFVFHHPHNLDLVKSNDCCASYVLSQKTSWLAI